METVVISDREVPVITDYVIINGIKGNDKPGLMADVIEGSIFQKWISRLDLRFNIQQIDIQVVDCTCDGTILFIKIVAVIKTDGKIFTQTFTLREDAVSILIILNCIGERYAVMVSQPRVAVGDFRFMEIPAGIIDDNETVDGAAIREIAEETGILITPDQLIDLTPEICRDRSCGIFLSPGGTNDNNRIFLVEMEVSLDKLSQIEGRLEGVKNENENIVVKIIPLENFVTSTACGKSLAALALYEHRAKHAI